MPQPGDIIVVHSRTIVGKIIRWVTKSWASHVAVYIGDGYVFEARPGGAGPRAFADYRDTEHKIFRLRIPAVQRDKFVCALVQQNGEGYDYGQIFSIAVQRIFGFDMRADNHRLAICSELIYRAAQAANIPVPSVPERLATPGDFLTWAAAFQVQE